MIKNPISSDLFSLQIYDSNYFKNFSPHTVFTKWALAEVPDHSNILDDRPHFELLIDSYKNNSPDSEEEIWIPISN